ncbi:unnamed protein product [Caenorhabditis angaria]|uniref:Uncharacterized protein n=1 Tax=Caenorhabditis angaria TaxID=860376 RepID=A0A9P1N788_9PELO|nr:unnamed protein product [Caenorhabditis angaria]
MLPLRSSNCVPPCPLGFFCVSNSRRSPPYCFSPFVSEVEVAPVDSWPWWTIPLIGLFFLGVILLFFIGYRNRESIFKFLADFFAKFFAKK